MIHKIIHNLCGGIIVVAKGFNRRRGKGQIERKLVSFTEVGKGNELMKHFQTICAITPLVAIQGYDESGHIYFWNRASEELYGYTAEEVISKNIKEILLDPEEWEEFDRMVQRVIESETPLPPQKWKVKTKDGKEKHLLSTMLPIVSKGKKYVYCMDVDITEQVDLYERLSEQERFYRTIVEAAHEGIWVVNEDFKTVFVNTKIAEILGYSPSYIVGKSTLEFVPEEEHQDVLLRRSNRKKGIFEQYERTLICANGERKIFLVNAAALLDSKGKFKGAVGFFADITERKHLERLIERERNLLKEYLNLSPSIFLVLDHDGNITFANKAIEQILSPEGSMIGKNWFDNFTPLQEREKAKKSFQKMIESPDDSVVGSHEILVVSGRGEERILSIRCRVLKNGEGKKMGIICAGLDITEQKRAEREREALEERIKQTQRLESIGVLAGSIAHDFNNLLVGIVGNTDLAMMELPQEHPAQKYLGEVIKISKKLTHISNQLLTYAGKAKTYVREISLTELIKNLETLIELSVANKKIAVKYELDDNIPLISADPLYVQQLIIDLITNSAEAIGDKSGVITIVTRCMFCDRKYFEGTYFGHDNPEGDYVYLEVADTGPGIPDEVKQRMFEPFYSTKIFGRGLGLSAVAGIVKAHKGAIKVYTELGKGTSIKVLFPAIRGKSSGKGEGEDLSKGKYTESVEVEREFYKGLILVVDDEKMVRETVKNMLEQGGYKVITAEDGQKAIETYKVYKDSVDLVLLDMTMPIYDGEETFRELRRIKPDVKVILSSGYNIQDLMDRFVGKGLAGFIQKPFILSTLLKTIESVLGKNN